MGISEEEIKGIITPLLLSGAKMLDKHCPKCGSPLFEKNERIFCPICEHRRKQGGVEAKGVEEILIEKFETLAGNLPSDVDELSKYLDVMEKILIILERYRTLEVKR